MHTQRGSGYGKHLDRTTFCVTLSMHVRIHAWIKLFQFNSIQCYPPNPAGQPLHYTTPIQAGQSGLKNCVCKEYSTQCEVSSLLFVSNLIIYLSSAITIVLYSLLFPTGHNTFNWFHFTTYATMQSI